MLAPPEKRNRAADGNPGEVNSINDAGPTYSTVDQDVKSFTSRKLEWLTHVSADAFVKPLEFKIAFVIAQHVNAKAGIAFLSDEVIAEYVKVDIRTIRRARKALKDLGWISWNRAGMACAYKLLFGRIASVADEMAERRSERLQRREDRLHDRTPVSGSKTEDRTSVTADRTLPSADRTLVSADRTPESAIHLILTPSETPDLTPLLGALAPMPDGFIARKQSRRRKSDGKRTRRIKTDLPDDWVLSDEQWASAARLGLTGDQIETGQRKLKRWVKDQGKRSANWDSFVANWFERELTFVDGNRVDEGRNGFDDFLKGADRNG